VAGCRVIGLARAIRGSQVSPTASPHQAPSNLCCRKPLRICFLRAIRPEWGSALALRSSPAPDASRPFHSSAGLALDPIAQSGPRYAERSCAMVGFPSAATPFEIPQSLSPSAAPDGWRQIGRAHCKCLKHSARVGFKVAQYPSPQRYCHAIPAALNSLPVRVVRPVLA